MIKLHSGRETSKRCFGGETRIQESSVQSLFSLSLGESRVGPIMTPSSHRTIHLGNLEIWHLKEGLPGTLQGEWRWNPQLCKLEGSTTRHHLEPHYLKSWVCKYWKGLNRRGLLKLDHVTLNMISVFL